MTHPLQEEDASTPEIDPLPPGELFPSLLAHARLTGSVTTTPTVTSIVTYSSISHQMETPKAVQKKELPPPAPSG